MRTKTIAVSSAGRVLGEDSPRARWTDAEVNELRRQVEAGEDLKAVAAALGMPFETARDVVRYRRRATTPAGWVIIRDGRKIFVG